VDSAPAVGTEWLYHRACWNGAELLWYGFRAGKLHHARSAAASCAVCADENAGMYACGDGSLISGAGSAAAVRNSVWLRSVYQSDTGASGLSPHNGGILSGKAKAVRKLRLRGHQYR